jgi:hypothetical protein
MISLWVRNEKKISLSLSICEESMKQCAVDIRKMNSNFKMIIDVIEWMIMLIKNVNLWHQYLVLYNWVD